MRVATYVTIGAIGMAAAFVASPSFANETITYTYDVLGRLVRVVHAGTVNNNMQTNYAFDATDNRNSMTTVNAPH